MQWVYIDRGPVAKAVLIGDDGHGKTALMSAISRLAELEANERYRSTGGGISGVPCDGPREDSVRFEEYLTDRQTIEFVDLPLTGDYAQHLFFYALDADGVVVVVSALAGCSQRTHEALTLLRAAEVCEAVVWVSHCDVCEDPALLDLIDDEARNLLSRSGFSADTPVIHGAAGRALRNNPEATATLRELLAAVDSRLPSRPDRFQPPFLLPVMRVRRRAEDEWFVSGSLERGKLLEGSGAELVGASPTRCVKVKQFRVGGQARREAREGEILTVLLSGDETVRPQVGDVLAAPETITSRRAFEALIYVIDQGPFEQSLLHDAGLDVQFVLRNGVAGSLHLLGSASKDLPEHIEAVRAVLAAPVAIEPGQRFDVHKSGPTLATGLVTKPAW